ELLHLIVNSLYSNRDIFLRELISNASDAIDRLRFESLTKSELLEGDSEWKIKIIPDKKANTLTITDNGIGMNIEELAQQLGTIAKSGTKVFMQTLKSADVKDLPELIGQFGVGFYSSFMVSDRVTVISRKSGDKQSGAKWESEGKGEFTVEQIEREKRGTDVILHLKDECKNYLDEWEIRRLVKKYSDYVEHPIVMDVEKEDQNKKKKTEEETLNSRKAVWLKSKNEVKDEEYNEFYKHISHDFDDPFRVIHYSVEGVQEFKALLYIPKKRPFDLFYHELKNCLHLYIKRVFIMENCEKLMPEYLRFVKGVVDSSDLPLNVSREILQQNAQLEKIKSNLVNKVLSTLKEIKEKEYEKYVEFYKQFGAMIKEGVHGDWENREKLMELLLYESTKSQLGKYVTLRDYIKAMPEEQKDIYYIIGESRSILEKSPYLELFVKKGYEVLFMTEPIDEWLMGSVYEYEKKRFKAAHQGEIDVEDSEIKKEIKEKEQGLKDFLGFIKEKLPDLKEVRLSNRLTESVCCLVGEEGSMGMYMEKIMLNLHHNVPKVQRILEINPRHPLVEAMHALFKKDPKNEKLVEYAELLYDQALIAEGSKIKDPLVFAKRLNNLMVRECEDTAKK
ncbi:MAG: molecular chaperone HtpG, partial [Elusimicrobiota bacterium]